MMMPLSQFLQFIPAEWQGFTGFILVAGTLAITCFKSFKFVPQGELAMRKRGGKILVRRDGTINYLKPGRPQILIPFFDTLEYVSVLKRTVPITATQIPRDGQLIKIDGVIVFDVVDIFRVRYAVDDFAEQIRGSATAAFRNAIIHLWDQAGQVVENLSDEALQEAFIDYMEADAAMLGVTTLSVRVTEYSPDGQFAIAQAITNASTPRDHAITGLITSSTTTPQH